MSGEVFEREAERYDAWYDTQSGVRLFETELETLRPLIAGRETSGLEVGTGTGRFAQRLGITYGVDPAVAPLRIAQRRGVTVIAASGEYLPFCDHVFSSVTFVFTLCFVHDPVTVIREAARVVRSDGLVIIGVVPGGGPLGRHYQRLGTQGHRIYRIARFLDRPALEDLIDQAGLSTVQVRSAVIDVVDNKILPGAVLDGDQPDAGFLVYAAARTSR
jgi:ubiquinone/menaquinone biosynthesis C-methylase UbiE